jgi:hypothetical protein
MREVVFEIVCDGLEQVSHSIPIFGETARREGKAHRQQMEAAKRTMPQDNHESRQVRRARERKGQRQ